MTDDGGIIVIKGNTRNYLFVTIKILCILLILSFTFLVDVFGTSAAVNSSSPILSQHEPGGIEEWAVNHQSKGDDPLSANLGQEPTLTSKPSEVIVVTITQNPVEDNINNDVENDVDNGIILLPNDTQSGEQDQENVSVVPVDSTDNNVGDAEAEDAAQSTEDTLDTEGIKEDWTNALDYTQGDLDNVYKYSEDKVAYLTFDDGPIPSLTSAVLDILAQEEVKATFFIIGTNSERYPDMIKREYEEGHSIGNHTHSHVFKNIYESTENYTNELIQAEDILQSILGEDKEFKLTRFPGGSFGSDLAPFREAINKAGFLYIDWNSLNGDAETSKIVPADRLVQRFKETANGQSSLVVLMHDAPNKQTTIEALPEIIKFLKAENYRFELLPGAR